LKQINTITEGPLAAGVPGQLPPLPSSLNQTLRRSASGRAGGFSTMEVDRRSYHFAVAGVAIETARAAYAQSFALWHQATIEIMRRNHSIITCSRRIHLVLHFAHIPFVVNHTFNPTPMERSQHTTSRIIFRIRRPKLCLSISQ